MTILNKSWVKSISAKINTSKKSEYFVEIVDKDGARHTLERGQAEGVDLNNIERKWAETIFGTDNYISVDKQQPGSVSMVSTNVF